MKNKCLRKNIAFLLPLFILLSISLLDMYGASFISGLYSRNLTRQFLWIVIGFAILYTTYKIDLSFLLKWSGLFYILGVLSLILVLFFGKNINGATSWFRIGPFSFQPSELFKFFYILYLSKVIGDSRKGGAVLAIKIILLTFVPCILIFLEPDTGVVLMYLLMMFGLLTSSKVPKKYIVLLIATGIAFIGGFFVLYFLNGDLFLKLFGTSFFYRIDRLLSFKDASSYQISNALIGIGSSGLLGMGLTSSKIYIPEATTDFVFDLTICNFGLLAGVLVILIYAVLLGLIYREIHRSKKRLHRCILSGIFYMMLFQVGEHILMNLGLTPITGITLPFLSYGGSSLISYFMLFALIMKITTNNSSYS